MSSDSAKPMTHEEANIILNGAGIGIPWSSPDEQDGDAYLRRAQLLVRDFYHARGISLINETVYVVWFAKVLQNWKALVSTSIADGRYFEITHNGDKHETYVDSYLKESNTTIKEN